MNYPLIITVVVVGLVPHLADTVPTAELSQMPRDQLPTKCHKFLSPAKSNPYRNHADRVLCQRNPGRCNCSCDETCRKRQERVQDCCHAKGVKSNCLSLCRYEVDTSELFCKAQECADDLKTWVYCAADTHNPNPNVECCRRAGIPEKCLPLCAGNAPSRTELINVAYFPCLQKASIILQCHATHLPDKKIWETDGRTFGPQAPFNETQSNLLSAFRSPKC